MELDTAYNVLSKYYNKDKESIMRLLNNVLQSNKMKPILIDNNDKNNKINDNKKNDDINKINNDKNKTNINDIILPFNGKVNNACCKAIVFNHGLYTQCTKKSTDEICKSCNKLKYGRIEERLQCQLGEFVTSSGKKEVPYDKFIEKMNYNKKDVIIVLKNNNIDYKIELNDKAIEKKGRGRPRKIEENNHEDDNNEDENLYMIEVMKVMINGVIYWRTNEGVLLDKDSYEVVD